MIYNENIIPTNAPIPCKIGDLSGLSVDLVKALLNLTSECTCFPEGSESEVLQMVYEGVSLVSLRDPGIPVLLGSLAFI